MTEPSNPAPRQGRSAQSSGGPSSMSAGRGAILIGVAVIIGIVLLQLIDDGTTGPIGDGKKSTETTVTTSSGKTTTTTSAVPVKTPAQVPVLVLNGSGAQGAASSMTNTIKAKGYPTLTPADAPARTGSVVYFKPGVDRECTTLATSVGGNPQVAPIPTPAPTGSENASCVVILGA